MPIVKQLIGCAYSIYAGGHMNQTELAKIQAVRSESETIGAFLEWCESKGITLTKRVEPTEATEYQFRVPIGMSINQLLAEYFHIDLEKVDQEQRAILAELRRND
jgi:hypothetical protein